MFGTVVPMTTLNDMAFVADVLSEATGTAFATFVVLTGVALANSIVVKRMFPVCVPSDVGYTVTTPLVVDAVPLQMMQFVRKMLTSTTPEIACSTKLIAPEIGRAHV